MNKTLYKQTDSRWASKPYPTKGSSFGGNGCGCVACTHLIIEQEKYKKKTPEPFRKWMVKQGFAVYNQGTTWSGIPSTLQHYGYKKVVHIGINDSMSKAWKELNKGNRIGIILFKAGKAPNGTVWTTGGHYVAFTDYYVGEDGRHYFYTKDSGNRNNDSAKHGYYSYERSMKGLVYQMWIVEKISDKPEPEPEPKETDYKVIDISFNQKNVNFKKVKDDGIGGVIIRCGFRGYESGELQEDSEFQTHIKKAYKAGLPVGVYFFTEAINAKEGREEAEYAVSLAENMNIPLSYPIAIDTEYINDENARANNLSKAKRTKVIKAFCERIKELGYEPMIYASTSWLNNKLNMSKLPYKVWCAQYYTKCEYKGEIVMWQYSSKGKVNGISGKVDMNHCYIRPIKPEPKPEEKKSYSGSYPTMAEIKTASHNGIINRICNYGKTAAKSGEYVYIKYLSNVKKTHQCPKCHNHKGKKGGNCIWFPFFCWRHGGGIQNRCACDAMTDPLWEKVLNAKTDAKANDIVRKRLKIKDVEVIRNGGKEIPQSMLKAGDVCAYFKGNTYVHTVLKIFGNLIADCTSGRTPNLKYGVEPYTKWDIKVALRYTGSLNYLQKYDEGKAVKKLQNYLDWYFDGAFFAECGKADGVFGENTEKWVKKMQTDFFGVEKADGTVGELTIAFMKEVKK